MTTTTSERSTTLPLVRLAALVVSIAISIFCYELYILYAVDSFYMPDQPHYSFWLLWTPLALVASYLLFAGALGRWKPSHGRDLLLGPLLFLAVFAVLLVLAPSLFGT